MSSGGGVPDGPPPGWRAALRITGSEIDVFTQLCFGICATVVGVAGAFSQALQVPGHPVPSNIKEIVFTKVIAGMSVTMFVGNLYFVWLAVRLMKKENRSDVTCLPYGINTPAAFVFIFGIIGPAVAGEIAKGATPEEAALHGWRVGCVANLVAGVVGVLAGFVGPVIVKVAPKASLLIALAGIGFTWLGAGQIVTCFTAGYAGLAPLVMSLIVYFGGIDTSPVPGPLLVILVGMLMGWVSHQGWNDGGSIAAIQASFSSMGFKSPGVLDAETFAVIPEVLADNLSVILPVSITGAVGTLLNVYAAEQAGDSYPLREVMIFDGIGTCVAALFGSPLGTCVYIGHPAYKSLGGKSMYSLLNCFVFFALASSGLFALVQALVPPYAVNPLVLFVGLSINQDAFTVTPSKQYPAAIIGMFPAVADWSLSFWGGQTSNLPDYPGLCALKNGALLVSVVWTSIAVKVIYRRFDEVAIWSGLAMVLSAVGLMHQQALDLTFKNFLKPPFGTSPCSFTIGYASLCAIAGALSMIQRGGSEHVPEPEEEEEEADEDDEDDEKPADLAPAAVGTEIAKNAARRLTEMRSRRSLVPRESRVNDLREPVMKPIQEVELSGMDSSRRVSLVGVPLGR